MNKFIPFFAVLVACNINPVKATSLTLNFTGIADGFSLTTFVSGGAAWTPPAMLMLMRSKRASAESSVPGPPG